MAYEFRLSGTRPGPSREGVNPFTGKPGMRPTWIMSDDERDAVLATISRHGGSIEAGRGALGLLGAEITIRDFDDEGFDVSITGAIEAAIDVVFELATNGRLVVTNTHDTCDEPVPLVTTPEALAQANASSAEPGDAELVTDIGEFLRILLPGYQRKAVRD